jgi:hypothetical protein
MQPCFQTVFFQVKFKFAVASSAGIFWADNIRGPFSADIKVEHSTAGLPAVKTGRKASAVARLNNARILRGAHRVPFPCMHAKLPIAIGRCICIAYRAAGKLQDSWRCVMMRFKSFDVYASAPLWQAS